MINSPERPGILRANAGFLLAGAGLIVLNAVSPLLVRLLAQLGMTGGIELLCVLDAVYYLPCILVPLCIYASRSGGAGLRLAPVSLKQTLLCIPAAFLCMMLANSLAALWSIALESAGFVLYGTDIPMNSTNDLLLAICAVAVLPGVCEELLFRGLVLGAYERCGTRRAVFISALLFASLHGSLQGLPVQLAIGIILGCAVCFTGTLHTGIMIHMLYNAFVLILSYAGRNLDTGTYTTMYEYLGGVPGVIGVVIEGAITGALLLLILRSFAGTGRREGIEPVPKQPLKMDGTQIVVLISGIVTVLFLYGQDILMLTGYLR